MTRRILSIRTAPPKQAAKRTPRVRHHKPADIADFKEWVAAQVAACPPEDRANVERYLKAYPGRNLRDWKGKDPDLSPMPAHHGEVHWRKLKPEDVRELATITLARDLPHNYRSAAFHDPLLVYNPLARKYRCRTPEEVERG